MEDLLARMAPRNGRLARVQERAPVDPAASRPNEASEPSDESLEIDGHAVDEPRRHDGIEGAVRERLPLGAINSSDYISLDGCTIEQEEGGAFPPRACFFVGNGAIHVINCQHGDAAATFIRQRTIANTYQGLGEDVQLLYDIADHVPAWIDIVNSLVTAVGFNWLEVYEKWPRRIRVVNGDDLNADYSYGIWVSDAISKQTLVQATDAHQPYELEFGQTNSVFFKIRQSSEANIAVQVGTGVEDITHLPSGTITPSVQWDMIGNAFMRLRSTNNSVVLDGATGISLRFVGAESTKLFSLTSGQAQLLHRGQIFIDTKFISLSSAQAQIQHSSAVFIDTASGQLRTSAGAATTFQWDSTGIGFFGHATAGQQADVGALTDRTTGAADATVVDVGASFNRATLNNNFADLIAKINLLRDRLRAYGIMA